MSLIGSNLYVIIRFGSSLEFGVEGAAGVVGQNQSCLACYIMHDIRLSRNI